MLFDNGDRHTYAMESLRKLKPIVKDAHLLPPDALFAIMDADSSGVLDAEEFGWMHKTIKEGEIAHQKQLATAKAAEEKQREDAERTRKQLLVAVVFIVILLAGMAGLMVAVVAAYKDTKADGAYFSGTDGRVLQTAPAMVALPMVAAPVIPWSQLKEVQELAVSYADSVTGQEIQVSSAVESVALYNTTAVIFYMGRGPVDEVHVWNGEAFAVLSSGAMAAICANQISCSAFTVEDSESASTYLSQAASNLTAAGFDASVIEESRRRLSGRELAGECKSQEIPAVENNSPTAPAVENNSPTASASPAASPAADALGPPIPIPAPLDAKSDGSSARPMTIWTPIPIPAPLDAKSDGSSDNDILDSAPIQTRP